MTKMVQTMAQRMAAESQAPRIRFNHPTGQSLSGSANANVRSGMSSGTSGGGHAGDTIPPGQRRPVGQPQKVN